MSKIEEFLWIGQAKNIYKIRTPVVTAFTMKEKAPKVCLTPFSKVISYTSIGGKKCRCHMESCIGKIEFTRLNL